MNITTQIKASWIELTIKEGSAEISYDIWRDELIDIKTQLENVIEDINYMIDKLEIQGGNNEQQ